MVCLVWRWQLHVWLFHEQHATAWLFCLFVVFCCFSREISPCIDPVNLWYGADRRLALNHWIFVSCTLFNIRDVDSNPAVYIFIHIFYFLFAGYYWHKIRRTAAGPIRYCDPIDGRIGLIMVRELLSAVVFPIAAFDRALIYCSTVGRPTTAASTGEHTHTHIHTR